jgi:hypothetical protein
MTFPRPNDIDDRLARLTHLAEREEELFPESERAWEFLPRRTAPIIFAVQLAGLSLRGMIDSESD